MFRDASVIFFVQFVEFILSSSESIVVFSLSGLLDTLFVLVVDSVVKDPKVLGSIELVLFDSQCGESYTLFGEVALSKEVFDQL